MSKTVRYLILLTLLVSYLPVQGQYFQQQVNYDISCTLNDNNHTLDGLVTITYQNNSPNHLNYIYVHLYPNAYKDTSTAFATQKKSVGDEIFEQSLKEERGYIDSLDFKINGKAVTWEYAENNKDIALVYLHESLEPAGKLIVETPFFVKIPKLFSRMGHLDGTYSITQWYPKIATYDAKGWHPMPYLDMGEYYNDFGNYKINISLPKSYVVAATGIEKLKKSTDNLTTHTYIAENVTDFAWFANPNFVVDKTKVTLDSDKNIVVETYYLPNDSIWKSSINFASRAVKYFSEEIGEYPYPIVKVVQSGVDAGAGMEYPMITNVEVPTLDDLTLLMVSQEEMLDEIIAHEIAHNWFQATLATNERDYPWMDEGMTTYFEQQYMREYYGERPLTDAQNEYVQYHYKNEQSIIQLNNPPAFLSEYEYFLYYYVYSPRAFRYLKEYLGAEEMKGIFKEYFETWKFKHPSPEDFFEILDNKASKDVQWFKNNIIMDAQETDYAIIKGSDESFTIVHKQGPTSPFPLGLFQGDQLIDTLWVSGFKDAIEIIIPPKVEKFDRAIIDPWQWTNDFSLKNNTLKINSSNSTRESYLKDSLQNLPSTPLAKEPIVKFGLLNLKSNTPSIFPIFNYNNYDKFSPGILFHNYDLRENKFEYYVMPLYSLDKKSIVGQAGFDFTLLKNKKKIDYLKTALRSKSYHYWSENGESFRYFHASPAIEFSLKPISKLVPAQKWTLSFPFSVVEVPKFKNEYFARTQLAYWVGKKQAKDDIALNVLLQHQKYPEQSTVNADVSYLQSSIDLDYKRQYKKENKSIDIRLFAGGYLWHDEQYDNQTFNGFENSSNDIRGSYSIASHGYNDETFNDLYLGRSERSGVMSHQLGHNTLIRLPLNPVVLLPSAGAGRSNEWAMALNLTADLPILLPKSIPYVKIRPYYDLAFTRYRPTVNYAYDARESIFSCFGLTLDIFDSFIKINLPIADNSRQNPLLGYYLDNMNTFEKMTFSIQLDKLMPYHFRNFVSE